MSFGRLERTPGPQPMSDINMTPLVDVMLVLVVIFILTAPLMASSIRLDLPRTEGTPARARPQFVTVVVDATGQAFLDDQPLSQPAAGRAPAAHWRGPARHRSAVARRRRRALWPRGRGHGRGPEAGLQRIGFVAEPAKASAAVGA
jgi:biopolymer transport protein TolR